MIHWLHQISKSINYSFASKISENTIGYLRHVASYKSLRKIISKHHSLKILKYVFIYYICLRNVSANKAYFKYIQ